MRSGTRRLRRDGPPPASAPAALALTVSVPSHGSLGPSIAFGASGRPRLTRGWTARRETIRRYADLVDVAAVLPGRSGRRVQYWSFVDVARDEDRDGLEALPVGYDITVIAPLPMGWELPKTHGHAHVRPDGSGRGYPELYQVLSGEAGFLFQDTAPGPSARRAVLIEAGAGESVVIPPLVHHVTINLGPTPLIVADAVCRESDDDYSAIRAAHGMAYLLGANGRAIPNPSYRALPELLRTRAQPWAGASDDVYRTLIREPDVLEWLCGQGAIPTALRAPEDARVPSTG